MIKSYKFYITSFIIFILISSLATIHAASTIAKIKFNQGGALKISKDLLLYNISQQSGKEFSQQLLNDDIKRLKETGYFSDVEAVISKPSDNTVDITFNLKTTAKIEKIVITGNEKISTEDILEHIAMHKGEPLNEKLLRRSISNLQKLYLDNGYVETKIYPSTNFLEDDNVEVTFHIVENVKLRVYDVYFPGNTIFSNSELAETVQTRYSYLNLLNDIDFTGLLDKYFNMGLYDEKVVKNDKLRLRNLFWTRGYLDFSVKVKTKPSEGKDFVDVYFEIHEGKPYKIGDIAVEGNSHFKTKILKDLLYIKKGETYDYRNELDSIRAIKDKYARLGYCDFVCKPEIDEDFQSHIVDIVLSIYEGDIYKIKDIFIKGNRITKDYVIRRELPFEPGQPVDEVLVDAGKSRLMAMNYFKKVEAFTTASGEPEEKNITYDVEEKGTAHASIGGGWSSDNSLVGRLNLSESNFDISDPSTYFRGGGQRVDLMAQVGLERMDFALTFTEPWLFGIPLRLDTTGFFHTRTYEYWDESHIGFDLKLSKPFLEFNSVSIGYVLDFVDVRDMDKGYSKSFRDEQEGITRRGAISASIDRDTRNSLMNPTSGYLLRLGTEINTELLAATQNYYKLDAKGSGYWNFLDEFFVLHVGGMIGTIGSIGSSEVPVYSRYFLGGQNSIRGFEYRKVAPVNSNGLPLGGQSMIVLTAEVSHPIYKWIRGAPFVDVGNAWSNAWDYSIDMNVGVGYGLRILVPQVSSVPLKLDLGIPIYKTESSFSSGIQFYFDIGLDW